MLMFFSPARALAARLKKMFIYGSKNRKDYTSRALAERKVITCASAGMM
jgi:hypothetical protein